MRDPIEIMDTLDPRELEDLDAKSAYPLSGSEFLQRMSEGTFYKVALYKAESAGYMECRWSHCFTVRPYVVPRNRRLGIASRMPRWARHELHRRGGSCLSAPVMSDDLPTKALLNSFSFCPAVVASHSVLEGQEIWVSRPYKSIGPDGSVFSQAHRGLGWEY